jgi:hypothetical protein
MASIETLLFLLLASMMGLKTNGHFLFPPMFLGVVDAPTFVGCLIRALKSKSTRLMMVGHYEGLGLNADCE